MTATDANLSLAEAALDRSVCTNLQTVGGSTFRCGSRHASLCPGCAKLYHGDVKRIARSGIFDADGQIVEGFEYFFLTLTAPSFGKPHRGPHKETDAPVSCECGAAHSYGDELIGAAQDSATYDYEGLARWNTEGLPQLWNVTNTHLRRVFSEREVETWEDTATRRGYRTRSKILPSWLAVFATREVQKRGAIHIHAVLRAPIGRLSYEAREVLEEVRRCSSSLSYPSGTLVEWGREMRIDRLNFDPENAGAALRTVSYALKAVNYSLKSIAQVGSPRLSRAMYDLREYIRHEFKCSPGCGWESHSCGPECEVDGVVECAPRPADCGDAIHEQLEGSGRTWSASRNWTHGTPPLTLELLREQRRLWASAISAKNLAGCRRRRGPSEVDMMLSRALKRSRYLLEDQRRGEAAERWRKAHPEPLQGLEVSRT